MKIDIPHPDKKDSLGINITIHSWDTWSMDYTLSYIIVPMLIQLKETKHGAPNVDMNDVPENLRANDVESRAYLNSGKTDENYFKRWDWVLDEMIWAFTYKRDNFDSLLDEDREAAQERMSNGFRLFGKYYESLWD